SWFSIRRIRDSCIRDICSDYYWSANPKHDSLKPCFSKGYWLISKVCLACRYCIIRFTSQSNGGIKTGSDGDSSNRSLHFCRFIYDVISGEENAAVDPFGNFNCLWDWNLRSDGNHGNSAGN